MSSRWSERSLDRAWITILSISSIDSDVPKSRDSYRSSGSSEFKHEATVTHEVMFTGQDSSATLGMKRLTTPVVCSDTARHWLFITPCQLAPRQKKSEESTTAKTTSDENGLRAITQLCFAPKHCRHGGLSQHQHQNATLSQDAESFITSLQQVVAALSKAIPCLAVVWTPIAKYISCDSPRSFLTSFLIPQPHVYFNVLRMMGSTDARRISCNLLFSSSLSS